jgi:hypothetical protein
MKVLSFRTTVHPKHGIVAYGTVQSRTDKRKRHVVTARKHGERLRFACSCDDFLFRRHMCDHIIAIANKARRVA